MHKKILLVTLATLGLSASAFGYMDQQNNDSYQAGPYLGVQAGLARANEGDGIKNAIEYTYNNSLSTADKSKDITQGSFGGRAFAGWNFNPYFSIETGYTQFADNEYKTSGTQITTLLASATDLKVSSYSVDLMAKASLPLYQMSTSFAGWSLYGKLGMAYMYSKISGTENEPTFAFSGKESHSAWCPTYGVGFGYNFDQSLGIDASWTQILGKHKTSLATNSSSGQHYITNADSFSPTTNLFALGITFKFVNL